MDLPLPHDSQWGSYGEGCLSPEPSSTCKSLVNEPPSRLPSGAPMERDAHPLSLIPHILLDPQQRSPPPGSPNRAPEREMLPFWSPPSTISQNSQWIGSPQIPHWGPYRGRHLFPEISSTPPLIIHLSLKVPGKGAPPPCSPTGSLCSISRASGLFIHLHPSESPVKESSHESGENIQSPSMEPYTDGRPTMGAVWFPKGIVFDIASTIPVPCSLQHDIFHLGLSRPERH